MGPSGIGRHDACDSSCEDKERCGDVTKIAEFAQPARYFEFFDYGDGGGTTVAQTWTPNACEE